MVKECTNYFLCTLVLFDFFIKLPIIFKQFSFFISADRYTVTNAIEKPTSILNDALTAMTQLPITNIHQALANDIQQFQAKMSSVSEDDTLSEICKDIVGTVWKVVSVGNDSKSQSSKFDKMCSAFHSISISGLLRKR